MATSETCRPCADGRCEDCARIIRREGQPRICACWREHRSKEDS